MLNAFNSKIQSLMPILTPLCVLIGVIFHNIGAHLLFLVPFLFAFMTFTGSLGMRFTDVKVFKKHPGAILFVILFIHLLMPLWAYFLSSFIFDDHLLVIGFVISVAVPTGVTSIIWISICRGNFPLGLSIILIDTLLAPFILPVILYALAGEAVTLDTASIILDLIWMIVLPSILGLVISELRRGEVKEMSQTLAPFSKLSLFGIVAINSSAVAPFLTDITLELIGVILFVFILAASGYGLALIFGHLLFRNTKTVTSLVFLGGMRNIAVGTVIAVTYFPAKVAMPVVFGMLFQQVLASLYAKVVNKYQAKYEV